MRMVYSFIFFILLFSSNALRAESLDVDFFDFKNATFLTTLVYTEDSLLEKSKIAAKMLKLIPDITTWANSALKEAQLLKSQEFTNQEYINTDAIFAFESPTTSLTLSTSEDGSSRLNIKNREHSFELLSDFSISGKNHHALLHALGSNLYKVIQINEDATKSLRYIFRSYRYELDGHLIPESSFFQFVLDFFKFGAITTTIGALVYSTQYIYKSRIVNSKMTAQMRPFDNEAFFAQDERKDGKPPKTHGNTAFSLPSRAFSTPLNLGSVFSNVDIPLLVDAAEKRDEDTGVGIFSPPELLQDLAIPKIAESLSSLLIENDQYGESFSFDSDSDENTVALYNTLEELFLVLQTLERAADDFPIITPEGQAIIHRINWQRTQLLRSPNRFAFDRYIVDRIYRMLLGISNFKPDLETTLKLS